MKTVSRVYSQRRSAVRADSRVLSIFLVVLSLMILGPRPLAGVEPALEFSLLLGATNTAQLPLQVAVDGGGSVYVTGTEVDGTTKDINVFVTKFTPNGSVLYHVQIGGSAGEIAGGIAVDTLGNAYVAGGTASQDFPTKNGKQFQRFGKTDAFVVKLDPAGNVLYATLLGGTGDETARAIAVDGAGAAYVTGFTSARDFLVPNVKDAPVPKGTFQGRLSGASDAFVVKVAPDGRSFAFKTFLGGAGAEQGVGIAVDGHGSCYVLGATDSADFPVQNPAQKALGGFVDAFITKFTPDGSGVVYSTYLGGSANEVLDQATPIVRGGSITVDAQGNVYVGCDTFSDNFPLRNPIQNKRRGEADGFVTVLNADGSDFLFSTYLGGAQPDSIYGIALAPDGRIVVCGGTQSANFPTTSSAFQAQSAGQTESFVAWLDPQTAKLEYSTFLGGALADVANSVAVGADGSAYVTGLTTSTNDFPLTTARAGFVQTAFLTKFKAANSAGPPVILSIIDVGTEVELEVHSPPRQTLRLEASPDFLKWTTLVEFSSNDGEFFFSYPKFPGIPALFFRTRKPSAIPEP